MILILSQRGAASLYRLAAKPLEARGSYLICLIEACSITRSFGRSFFKSLIIFKINID